MKDIGKNALVTGGAGFIGSHLCETLLKKGWDVVSVDNFCDYYNPAIKSNNIDCVEKTALANGRSFKNIEADIRDRSSLKKVFSSARFEIVIHLAAMAGVRASMEKPALYEDVNINGTRNILDLLGENGIERFVFGSSSSVYGNTDRVPFREDQTEYTTLSPYASTKRRGELICIDHAEKHKIDMALLRFFTVYGPRQRPDMAINKFVRLSVLNRPVPFYGDGTMKRDFTYVDDIVSGITASIDWLIGLKGPGHGDKKAQVETFNLARGEMITLNQLVESLGKALGREVLLDRLDVPKTEMALTFADTGKAKNMLGYEPKFSLEAGIANFVRWFKETDYERFLR